MSSPDKKPKAQKMVGVRVKRIALCRAGKSQLSSVYMSEEGPGSGLEIQPLFMAQPGFEERGLLTTVFMAPNLPFSDGKWVDAETIREAQYDFAINGEGFDIEHAGDVLKSSEAALVESTTIQAGDPRFDGFEYAGRKLSSHDLAGGWGGIIKIGSPVLRAAYRAGWNGSSIDADVMLVDQDPPETVAAVQAADSGTLLSALRRMLRNVVAPSNARDLRGFNVNFRLPKPGELDFDGNFREPTVSVSIDSSVR